MRSARVSLPIFSCTGTALTVAFLMSKTSRDGIWKLRDLFRTEPQVRGHKKKYLFHQYEWDVLRIGNLKLLVQHTLDLMFRKYGRGCYTLACTLQCWLRREARRNVLPKAPLSLPDDAGGDSGGFDSKVVSM